MFHKIILLDTKGINIYYDRYFFSYVEISLQKFIAFFIGMYSYLGKTHNIETFIEFTPVYQGEWFFSQLSKNIINKVKVKLVIDNINSVLVTKDYKK